MNKKDVSYCVVQSLVQDLITAGKAVGSFLAGGFIVIYLMATIFLGLIWLSVIVDSVWLAVWEPWAISIAPYWIIGNFIVTLISWVGYSAYQTIKTQ